MTPRFHPFVRLLLCAVALFAVTVALTLILGAGNYISTVFTDAPPKESFEQMVKRLQLAITLLTYPACLLVINSFRTKCDRASFVSLGLRPIKVAPNLLKGAVAGTLAIGILWSILWLTGAIIVEGWSAPFFEDPIGAMLPLTGYFLAFCAVAFFEETLFRGYILHNLNAWVGWRWAVVGQAILFAVIHLGNVVEADAQGKIAALWSLPALFLIAVFFAVCYKKTGSLWFPIGFHALWNFSLGCLFSLPVSGIETFRILEVSQNTNSLLSGGSFGAEGSLYLPVLLLAMIYFISGAPNHPQAKLDLSLLTKSRETASLPAASTAIPQIEEEDEEEVRTTPNRFNARFGSQEGFDSQMLRELRELQKAREEAKAAELAAQKTAAQAPTPMVALSEPVTETPTFAPVAVANPVATSERENVSRMEQPSIVSVAATAEKATPPEKQVLTPESVKPTVATPETVTPEVAKPELEAPKPQTPPVTPPKKPSPKW